MRRLPQTRHTGEPGRGLSAATGDSARSCRAGMLLVALWAFSTVGLASKPRAHPPLLPSVVSTSMGQSLAITDLDGDGRPDLAFIKAEGWGPNGLEHRIELHLTSGAGPRFLKVYAGLAGLRISHRNLDDDGDRDLVITTEWSLTPVAVFINDGHGRFTEADPDAYPRSLWPEEGPEISTGIKLKIPHADTPQSCRLFIDFPARSHFSEILVFDRLPHIVAADLAWIAVSQPQTRAPPLFSSQQPR